MPISVALLRVWRSPGGHYMDRAPLKNRFDTLEVPRQATSVYVGGIVSDTVATVRAALGV